MHCRVSSTAHLHMNYTHATNCNPCSVVHNPYCVAQITCIHVSGVCVIYAVLTLSRFNATGVSGSEFARAWSSLR